MAREVGVAGGARERGFPVVGVCVATGRLGGGRRHCRRREERRDAVRGAAVDEWTFPRGGTADVSVESKEASSSMHPGVSRRDDPQVCCIAREGRNKNTVGKDVMYTKNDCDSKRSYAMQATPPVSRKRLFFCLVDDDRGATIQIELGNA